MKNGLRITFILLGFASAMLSMKNALAGAYVLPISYSADLWVVQEIVAWDENDTDLNPCYGWSSCYLGPDVLYPTHSPGLGGSCESNNCIRIESYRTRKQVLNAWISQKGLPHRSLPYKVQQPNATCVGLFYIRIPSYSARDGAIFPGSVCGKLPPVNQQCNVVVPSAIDFGVVNDIDVAGKQKTITGYVYCSQAGTIALYSQSTLSQKNTYLSQAQNFYATLNINGQDGWSGVSIATPGNNAMTNFTLQATLQAPASVSAGSYTGNAIVFISYP